MFDALALLALAWGLAPLTERRFGPASGTTLRGAGAIGATAVFFPSLAENLGAVTVPLCLAIAGTTLLQADARRARTSPALATVGAALTLAGLGLAFSTAESFPEPARLRAALLLGGALLLAGIAARLILLRTRLGKLAPMPVGIAGAALLLSVYVSYRPLAAQHVNNLPLYEWTLAAGVALLLLGRLRRAAREHETAEAWSLDARRHAQDVRPVYDPRMTPLAAVFQRYLEHAQGFEEYQRALEQAHGGALPRPLTDTLEAARNSHRGLATPKARRDARERRLAAHRDVLARL